MSNFLKPLSAWILAAGLELGNSDASAKLIGDPLIELLMHMDGANGGTIFIDNSLNQQAFTAQGGAVTSTVQSKFGGASGYFPSAATARIESDSNNDILFFPGDFTIEFWVRFISYNAFQAIGTSGDTGNFVLGLVVEFGSSFGFRLTGDEGNGILPSVVFLTDNQSSLTGLLNDTWYKVVIQRSGTGSNNLQIWLGTSGALTLRGQTRYYGSIGTPSRPFSIGRYSYANLNQPLNAYVDEYRIAKKAMYVGTPTAEVSAFPDSTYATTSPVASMGWVALTAGIIITGIGNEITELQGSSTIQAAYRANNGAWSSPFASIALMNAFLEANPVTITDEINSFDIRLTFNSNGLDQAEAFVSEGPDLDFVAVCDFPGVGEVTEGTVYDDGNLTGTYKEVPEDKAELDFEYGADGTEFKGELFPITISMPLGIIELPGLEVIEL